MRDWLGKSRRRLAGAMRMFCILFLHEYIYTHTYIVRNIYTHISIIGGFPGEIKLHV